ncbi:hypothetical protein O1L60_33175 [Streptomyces diastatochromogenes]|nr:hypothetical protein [Streptomyces diastatochromogenes]
MRAATDLLARDAGPSDRVRARLAVLDTAGQGLTGLDEMYAHAMEDSEGDTALRAAVQLRLAVKYVLADGDPERSRTAAVESAALAASMGDPRLAVQALTVQARMERASGSRTRRPCSRRPAPWSWPSGRSASATPPRS